MSRTNRNRQVGARAAAGRAPPKGGEVERVVTLDEALAYAQRAQREGYLDDAEQIYRAVLERRPDDPDALHFLGILMHQRDDSEAAIELIRRAIAVAPEAPGPRNNLGNVLLEAQRVDEAVEAYQACLALAPDFAETHNNLGTIHRARGQFEQAEACYRRAIEIRPDFVDAHQNMANLMWAQRRVREAVAYGCRAITLDPGHASARKLLGIAYYTLGELDQAAKVYRDWLADEPGNPIAQHQLAACTGAGVPPRASDAYVEATFDSFAASFDAKLQKLNYRAPELVAGAIREACGEPARRLDMLDAGCGTGLCGPLVREFARRLVGVDLSAGMLERARKRGAYDAVEKAELVAYLGAHPGAFDVVFSADTLCYFGDLDAALRAARNALRDGGILVFTVEALEGASDRHFRLQPHGRYAHAQGYLRTVLAAAGFDAPVIARHELRREGGLPVAGWLAVARCGTHDGARPQEH